MIIEMLTFHAVKFNVKGKRSTGFQRFCFQEVKKVILVT
jgi:hypothetical protein